MTPAEVTARIAAGKCNTTSRAEGRTLSQIVRANVFTRFNAILGGLFVVVLIVGPIQDALFGVVLAVNTAIGLVQEVRAKCLLDRLAVLTAPVAHARRDAVVQDVPIDAVVVDDVLEVRTGDQVVADGVLVEAAGLEVDESLLSGESLAVAKVAGDEVWSGSLVVAGAGTMKATRVGDEATAQRIQREGRRYSLVRSELVRGNNRLLQLVTWVMVPAGVLLVISQVVRSGLALDEAVRGTVAGVGAMVPEGLVLLTSIAFAVGATRLAHRRVLVQELAAIEGLARVDVLCIDKTGTLTEPGMRMLAVEPLDGAPAAQALGAMAAADPVPNSTMLAARVLPAPEGWQAGRSVPFSSARKWSAMDFGDAGTWVLGAPEVVLPGLTGPVAARVSMHAAAGRRVLLLARSVAPLLGDDLPPGLAAAGLMLLEERLRPEAAATLGYLRRQGVAVKILSGDSPATVAAVAARVGVGEPGLGVDARTLPSDLDALAEVLEGSSVFGRVQPQQKRDAVLALQARGHVVAMTGDGVNDIPALKAADISMAMGTGSPATRAVGRLVLLDSEFGVVPHILGESRRVIANVQRVANLFVTKTVYAAVLAVAVGLSGLAYPFYPRHLTIVSTLTIGIPGFYLALAPGAPRAGRGYLQRVLHFAVPAGVVAGAATLGAFVCARNVGGGTLAESRTVATWSLLVLGLVVLLMVARPLRPLRLLVVAVMAGGAVVVSGIQWFREVFALAVPPPAHMVWSLVVVAVAVPLLLAAVAAGSRLALGEGAARTLPLSRPPPPPRP
ncbi:MAG: HAD-IC family P-type ATPase [Actinomycetota bacterium]|nr:HAD-IC family P-type ATPase [Actinomycetota bacterium]